MFLVGLTDFGNLLTASLVIRYGKLIFLSGMTAHEFRSTSSRWAAAFFSTCYHGFARELNVTLAGITKLKLAKIVPENGILKIPH